MVISLFQKHCERWDFKEQHLQRIRHINFVQNLPVIKGTVYNLRKLVVSKNWLLHIAAAMQYANSCPAFTFKRSNFFLKITIFRSNRWLHNDKNACVVKDYLKISPKFSTESKILLRLRFSVLLGFEKV